MSTSQTQIEQIEPTEFSRTIEIPQFILINYKPKNKPLIKQFNDGSVFITNLFL